MELFEILTVVGYFTAHKLLIKISLQPLTMMSAKRIADAGYRLFSGSMMLLTLYGGYLCVYRAQRYFEKQKQLEAAAQDQTEPELKG